MKYNEIAFCGYYGNLNSGDDSFCAIAAWGAHKFWKIDDVTFLSKSVPILTKKATCIGTGVKSDFEYLIKLVRCVRNIPVLVYAGGSIFHGREGLNRKAIDSFTSKKCIVGAIGVSIGPFKSTKDERGVINQLKKMSFLALRDKDSYDYAKSLNINCTPVYAFDLAAFMPKIYGTIKQMKVNKPKLLGVILCDTHGYGSETDNYINLVTALNHIGKHHNVKICFYIFNGNPITGDTFITKRMARDLDKSICFTIVNYCENPGVVFHAISQCDAVLSIRLHGGIFACLAKVPFILVEYHKKCTEFLNTINYNQKLRVGENLNSSDLENKLSMVLLNIEKCWSGDVESLIKISEQNFECMHELIFT